MCFRLHSSVPVNAVCRLYDIYTDYFRKDIWCRMKTGAEWATEAFKDDIYATEVTGIAIEEASENHAVLSVQLESKHRNAMNQVQGGVMFTLADFSFAIASGYKRPITVTLSAEIKYMSRMNGDKLIAEAVCLKDGRSTCFYGIDIRDELGTPVAYVTATGYRFRAHAESEFPAEQLDNPYREQVCFQKKS